MLPFVTKLNRSLSSRGLLGTLSEMPRVMFRKPPDPTPGDLDWDRRFDVNTGRPELLHRRRLPASAAFAVHYEPISTPRFHEVLRHLPVHHHEFTFLDLGSGRGKALLQAMAYPFRRVVGVEFVPAFHEAARLNLESYSGPRACSEATLLLEDATRCSYPSGPLVAFLFNPSKVRSWPRYWRTWDDPWKPSPGPAGCSIISRANARSSMSAHSCGCITRARVT
jgi:hypothetical protein